MDRVNEIMVTAKWGGTENSAIVRNMLNPKWGLHFFQFVFNKSKRIIWAYIVLRKKRRRVFAFFKKHFLEIPIFE